MPLSNSPQDSMHQHIPHGPHDEDHEFDHLERAVVHEITRREFLVKSMAGLAGASVADTMARADDSPDTMKDHDHHISPELQALIEKHWANQDKMYAEISRVGFQKFFDELKDKDEAFFSAEYVATAEKCACCSDEGNRTVQSTSSKRKEVLIRTPGSGILQALDEPGKNPFSADFITRTAKEALDAGVTHFTAHAGCGAAKGVLVAWLKEQGKEDAIAKLTPKDIDDFADRWAKAVTEEMRRLDPDHAKQIHEDMLTDLDRPKEIHVARCLYLTDIDELDTSFTGLPQGFVERTGGKDDLKDVLDHVDILRNIAFDPAHGFGSKFTEKPREQFVICCIARNPERLNKLKSDAEKKVNSLGPVAKKIRIDGFVRAA